MARIFTVPNQLTFVRLAFLPFFIIMMYYDRYAWALGILIAAALSDALDGVLARTLNQKTALGAYLDPIADKLLLSSSFFILAVKDKIDWWLTILVLSRDVIILATSAVILAVVGYRPLPPSLYGKATTMSQILLVFVAIAAAAFQNLTLDQARDVLVYLVAAFTVFSGLHYAAVIARRLSNTQG
jgi:cardiolipin synthase